MNSQKKTEPKLYLDCTREKLARLGLEHVAKLLEGKLSAAARDEIQRRSSRINFSTRSSTTSSARARERRIRTSLRLSGIPPGMTLGNFDYST